MSEYSKLEQEPASLDKWDEGLKYVNDLLKLVHVALYIHLAFHADNLKDNTRDRTGDDAFLTLFILQILIAATYKITAFLANLYGAKLAVKRGDGEGNLITTLGQDFLHLVKLFLGVGGIVELRKNNLGHAFGFSMVVMSINLLVNLWVGCAIDRATPDDSRLKSRGGFFLHRTYNYWFSAANIAGLSALIVAYRDHAARKYLLIPAVLLALPLLSKLGEDLSCGFRPNREGTKARACCLPS